MTKLEAEQEAIRRWYMLPEHLRVTYEHAEAYSVRLANELDFPSSMSRERLIAAWLIREVTTQRRLAQEVPAAAQAA